MGYWVPIIQGIGLLLSWQAQQQQSRDQQSQYAAQAAEYTRYANELFLEKSLQTNKDVSARKCGMKGCHLRLKR
jgi:hypothetical protein